MNCLRGKLLCNLVLEQTALQIICTKKPPNTQQTIYRNTSFPKVYISVT